LPTTSPEKKEKKTIRQRSEKRKGEKGRAFPLSCRFSSALEEGGGKGRRGKKKGKGKGRHTFSPPLIAPMRRGKGIKEATEKKKKGGVRKFYLYLNFPINGKKGGTAENTEEETPLSLNFKKEGEKKEY